MSYLIDMRKATVYRGNTKVLDQLSLTLPRERNIVILGPNGAGKTTLLKLLMRELYPVKQSDSWIKILGQETWNVWELRRSLGFVSQDLQNRYVGYVTGIEVVLSGFYSSVGVWDHQSYATEAKESSERLMEELQIQHLRDKQFSRMSTGEQRRFLLARALVSNPATLVLDEPTSGLDLTATFQYLSIIRKLMSAGKQIVLVTHFIHEIPPEVSFVVLMKEGRVVASGEKSKMMTSEQLGELYGTELRLICENGYYQAVPDD